MRPAVKPGAAVLRRDIDHLQVGTNPGVIIRDRPGLYRFLRALDGTRDVPTLQRHATRDHPELGEDVAGLLAPLIAAGAVIVVPDAPPPRLQLTVTHDLPSTSFAHAIGTVATAANVDLGPEPDVTVRISCGEPARRPLADTTAVGAAHLVVVIDGEEVRIGPFVVPGRTPCLGCLDLHRSGWDPAWPALIPQFGRPHRLTLSPLTEPVAAAEVVAQCLQYAEGRLPRTATEILTVGADRAVRVSAEARFHPRCGCALLAVA